MKRTLHLIRQDLHRFRGAALLWAILIVATIGLNHRLLASASSDGFMAMCNFLNLVYLLGAVVGYLLGAAIVLADPPAGSTAHWQTRPISGARLLAAKAIVSVLVMGMLPVLLWLPWWLHLDFSTAGVARASLNLLVAVLVPSLVGAAIAAVVDNVARFLVLTLVFVAAFVAYGIWGLVPQPGAPGVLPSRFVFGLMGLTATAVAAMTCQYITRRIRLARGIWIVGLAVIAVIRVWWPADISRLWSESPGPFPGAAAMSARLLPTEVALVGDVMTPRSELTIKMEMAGTPEGFFVAGGRADVELSWPDGTVVQRKELPVQTGWMGWDKSVRRALGFAGPEMPWPSSWDAETRTRFPADAAVQGNRQTERFYAHMVASAQESTASCAFPLSPELIAKMEKEPPAIRVEAEFATRRPVVLGEMPLKIGATMARLGQARVTALERLPATRQSQQRPAFHYTGAVTLARAPFDEARYLRLIDRSHQAVLQGFSYNTYQGTPALGGAVILHPFDLETPAVWRSDRWQEIPDWQQQLSLVEITSQPTGNFRLRLAAEKLEMVAPAGR